MYTLSMSLILISLQCLSICCNQPFYAVNINNYNTIYIHISNTTCRQFALLCIVFITDNRFKFISYPNYNSPRNSGLDLARCTATQITREYCNSVVTIAMIYPTFCWRFLENSVVQSTHACMIGNNYN